MQTLAIADYFSYKNAFQKSIEEGVKYIEIIDRTLDRKRQGIQFFWTFLLAVIAIVVSFFVSK